MRPHGRTDDAGRKQAKVPGGFTANDPRINRRGRPQGSTSGAEQLKQAVRGRGPESVALAEAVLTAQGPVADALRRPGGARKNARQGDVRRALEGLKPAAIKVLRDILADRGGRSDVRRAAAEHVLDRTMGKPATSPQVRLGPSWEDVRPKDIPRLRRVLDDFDYFMAEYPPKIGAG